MNLETLIVTHPTLAWWTMGAVGTLLGIWEGRGYAGDVLKDPRTSALPHDMQALLILLAFCIIACLGPVALILTIIQAVMNALRR